MTTLITGLGYIGSALARRLLGQGEHVVGIESFFSTPRAALAPLLDMGGLSLVEGSITDQAVLDKAFSFERIDTVFHLAAQASAHPDAAPLAYTQETNFTGPRLLLDACRAFGVQRVVLASSMRLYRTPLRRVVTEEAPVDPTDLVHLSQLYGEVLLAEHRRRAAAHGETGFDAVAARMGIVHGLSPVMKTDPRFLAVPQLFCLQAARRLPLVVASATGLAFLHLEDAVTGLLACRDHAGEVAIVNLASEVRTVASVAEAIRRAGEKLLLPVAVVQRGMLPRGTAGKASVESSLAAFEFRPTLRIEDSVVDVLSYYSRLGA